MGLSLNLGAWNSVFAVPCEVVDKHLRLCGENQLKVLLFILRKNGEEFTTDEIAEKLKINKLDVKDAIDYWINGKLLAGNNDVLTPVDKVPDKTKKLKNEKQKSTPSRPAMRRMLPNNFDLERRIKETPELSYIMQEAQMILGRTITTGDSAKLLMLYDTDGLPAEVIIMLVQYAVLIGKPSIAYIEKTGISWADEGINSIETAEKKINTLKEMSDSFEKIRKLLGLDKHSPTAKELSFAQKWVNVWGFSDAMIREAYERNIDTIGKFSYNYINGILSKWQKAGISTIKELKEIENVKVVKKTSKPTKKNNLQNFDSKATYDLEEYSKKSIFD